MNNFQSEQAVQENPVKSIQGATEAKDNSPIDLLEKTVPSHFDLQANQQFQKMMKDEEHQMSKNFQCDITDIPTIQVSAMN